MLAEDLYLIITLFLAGKQRCTNTYFGLCTCSLQRDCTCILEPWKTPLGYVEWDCMIIPVPVLWRIQWLHMHPRCKIWHPLMWLNIFFSFMVHALTPAINISIILDCACMVRPLWWVLQWNMMHAIKGILIIHDWQFQFIKLMVHGKMYIYHNCTSA